MRVFVLKGNLIRVCKKTVLACIMIAALTFSTTKELYVSAEGVAGDDFAAIETGQELDSGGDDSEIPEDSSISTIQDNTDNDEGEPAAEEADQGGDAEAFDEQNDALDVQADAVPSEEVQPAEDVDAVTDAAPADAEKPATEAPAEETAPVDDQAPAEDSQPTEEVPPTDEEAPTEEAPVEEKAPAAEKSEPAATVSALTVTGTTVESKVYNGESQDVQISLPSSSITVAGQSKDVVVASSPEIGTVYIAGIPNNTVTVSAVDATNDSNNTFDVALSGVTVYNEAGEDVSAPSTLTVTAVDVIKKKNVELVSMNIVKPYDGTPLENGAMPLAKEDGWVGNQGAYYTFTKSRTDIGTDVNEFTISSYKDGTNPDNYNIKYTFGGLSVVDRTDEQKYILTVEGANSTVKYNGQVQSISGFMLEGRSDSEYRVTGNGDSSQVLPLTIGNANFTVTGIAAYGSGKNAGEYTVNITGSPVIKDSEGNVVTNQFKFEFRPGKLTIEKRNVTLTSGSTTKTFDNKTHKKHKVTVSGDGFAEGEGATYKYTGKQKAVGQSYNYFTYTLNDGTLEENYNIEKVPGILKVKNADKAVNETPGNDKNDGSNSSDTSSSTPDTQQSTTPAPKTEKAATVDPNVLGAKRVTGDVTVDIANPADDNVLGARRSSTDDYSDLGRHIVVFAAAVLFMAILTIKRSKRIKK